MPPLVIWGVVIGAEEIRNLQNRIRNLREQLNNKGCGWNPDLSPNNQDLDRVLDRNSNPRPSDWRGSSP